MGAFSSAFVAHVAYLGRLAELRGTFEAHLTVATADRAGFDALCGELAVDHVGIELPHGAHTAQPMTASYHRGALPAVIAEVDALHAKIAARGFAIVRVKLEAVLGTDDLPMPIEGGYYEFHAKVRVPDPARLDELAALAAHHDARLSRNDRSRDVAGAQRFVTLRIYRSDRAAAEARLDRLLAALRDGGHTIAGTAREYTIYDSRVELDAGWLEPPP